MWPIQLAFLLFIVCRTFLTSLTHTYIFIFNTIGPTDFPIPLLSITELFRHFWSTYRSVQVFRDSYVFVYEDWKEIQTGSIYNIVQTLFRSFGDSFFIFETPVGAADWSDLLPFRNGRYQMFEACFYLHSQVRKIDTCRRIHNTHKVTLRIAYCACLPAECDILGCSYLNKIACWYVAVLH